MGVSPSSTGGAPVPVPPPRDSLPMPSPYGAPYGGGYGGYGGGPAPPMTPEQLQTAFMRGAPPYSQMGGPYAGYPGTWQAPPAPPARVEHAQTIRNDVNLRKGSLRMLCADSNPSQLYLDFMFDSNSPCAVTVFPVAVSREDAPAGVSLIQRIACHKYPHTGKRTLFRKGLGQQFSQAFRREEWIDTRAYTGFQLTTHPSYPEGRGTPSSTLGTAAQASVPSSRPEEYARLPLHLYPIIVVLETVPDSDPAFIVAQAAPPEGVTAPVMPPGGDPSVAPGAASSHVSLQVTYATLLHKPGEDARLAAAEVEGLPPGIRVAHDWIVKPLRQRIQVGGNVYDLREIYGIDGGSVKAPLGTLGTAIDAGTVAAEEVLASGSECVVCLTEKRDTTVLPCRHMCLCFDCAQQLRASTNKCPICRTAVASLLRIKIDGSNVRE